MDTVPVITLLDLPNELLDKICEYLSFFELITYSNTSRLLKTVTARAIGTRTNLDLNLMSSQFVKTKDEDGKQYLNSVARLLRAYGHQIVKLRYVTLGRTQAEYIIPLIVKYCSGNNLVDLTLGELNELSAQLIASLHPIYRHLRSLSLTFRHYNVCHSSLDLILASCVQLEKLNLNVSPKWKVIDFSNDRFILDDLLRNLVKPLKELCVNHNYNGLNYSDIVVRNLVNIFEHQQLRVFKMKGVFLPSPLQPLSLHIDTNIFNEMAPALEVLSLSIGDGIQLHPLLKLRHLKHLDVLVTGRRMSDFANFMQELVIQNRLECLSLRFIYLSYKGCQKIADAFQKVLDSLSHFNSLVTLKIDQSGRIADGVLECVKKLPNLIHFHASSASYSQDDILYLVQLATNIQTLHLQCNKKFWVNDFFEKLVKIRRDNKSDTVLNVYAYSWEHLCNQPKYSEMKSSFVNIFPTLKNKYP